MLKIKSVKCIKKCSRFYSENVYNQYQPKENTINILAQNCKYLKQTKLKNELKCILHYFYYSLHYQFL
jgi:hypothetical protein